MHPPLHGLLDTHKPGVQISLRLNPSKTAAEKSEVDRLLKIPISLRSSILFL